MSDGNKQLAIGKAYGGYQNIVRAVIILDYGEGHLSATLGEVHDGEIKMERQPRDVPPWESGHWNNPLREFVFGPWVYECRLMMIEPRTIVKEGSLDDLFEKGWTEQGQLPPERPPSSDDRRQ